MKRIISLRSALSLLLTVLMLAPCFQGVSSITAAASDENPPGAPTDLKVNLMREANNVDIFAAPVFSWVFQDEDYDEVQTAYQIQISTNSSFSAFAYDSGWVNNNNPVIDGVLQPVSSLATVAASTFTGNTLYHWRVRTKDKDGLESAWSAAHSFVTSMGGNGYSANTNGFTSITPMWIGTPAIPAWTDYTVESDITITQTALALVFRYSDSTHWYAMQFRTDATGISPLYCNGGNAAAFGTSYNVSSSTLAGLGVSLALNTKVRVKIKVSGTTTGTVAITTWVDMTPDDGVDDYVQVQTCNLTAATPPRLGSGTVGLRTGGSEAGYATYMKVTSDASGSVGNVLYQSSFTSASDNFSGTGASVSNGRITAGNNTLAYCVPGGGGSTRFVFFRRPFTLSPSAYNNIEKAVLAITGRGTEDSSLKSYYMDFYMNGESVGVGPSRDPLQGRSSATSVGQYYNSFDVTEKLQSGNNLLAFQAYSNSQKTALVQLTLFNKDGTRTVLFNSGSDVANWKAKDGTTAFGNSSGATYSAGSYITQPRENMDGTAYPTGWNTLSFIEDATWRAPVTNSNMNISSTRQLKPFRAENMHVYEMPAVSKTVVTGAGTNISAGNVTVSKDTTSGSAGVIGTWYYGSSGWTNYSDDQWNSTNGGWCELTFYGTSVQLQGKRGTDKVTAAEIVVTLDGVAVTSGQSGVTISDLYSATATTTNYTFVNLTGLADGKHTVRVTINRTSGSRGLSIMRAVYYNTQTGFIPGKQFHVFDLGKEIIGGLRLNIFNPTSEPIMLTVQQGESLIKTTDPTNSNPQTNYNASSAPYGSVRYDGWNDVPSYTETWVLAPGDNTLQTFLMKNYRWMQIVDPPAELTLTADMMTGLAVRQEFDDEAAVIESDNAFMQRLVELCRYSIKATNQDQYTDSQVRERRAYEGDLILNQYNSYAVSDNYALARHTNIYLLDYPTWPPEYKLFNIEMAWADYLWTGDKAMLEANYAKFQSKLPGGSTSGTGTGGGYVGNTAFNATFNLCRDDNSAQSNGAIVDWPTGEQDSYRRSGSTNATGALSSTEGSFTTVFNAVAYGAYLDMANIAEALGGRAGDVTTYRNRAAQIKASLISRLYDPNDGGFFDSVSAAGRSAHKAQHATFYALAYGIYNDQAMADKMADYLRRDISNRGLTCSVYGMYFLLRGLFNVGADDLANSIMLQEDRNVVRSWAHMLDVQHATITTEAWSPNNKPNMTYSHPWGGTPGTLITQGIFGIVPLSSGFNTFQVKFQPGNKVGAGSIKSPTAKGPICADFNLADDIYHVTVPANSRALISIPADASRMLVVNGVKTAAGFDGRFLNIELGSGTYEFTKAKPTLTVDGGTGGGDYFIGEAATATMTDRPGCVFVGWEASVGGLIDGKETDPSVTFNMPASDVTLTAIFEDILQINVTFDDGVNELSGLTSEKLVTTLKYKNWEAVSENLTMIVGVYSPDGKLAYLGTCSNADITAGVMTEFVVTLIMPDNISSKFEQEGYYANVYLWEGATFIPVMEKIQFPSD